MPAKNGKSGKNGASNTVAQRTAKRKAVYLEAFGRGRNASAAAKACGIGLTTVYRWREEDEEFAAAWLEIDLAIDADLESTLINRAINGWEEPLTYQGKLTGDTITRIDNRLLEFVAARRKPEKWLDRVVAAKAMDLSPDEEKRLEPDPRWL